MSKFFDFCAANYPIPETTLAAFFPEMVDAAASIGAQLADMPDLDGRRHYLPTMAGRRDQKQYYLASIERDQDGTIWPAITFKSFKGGFQYFKPRDLAWQQFEASRGAAVVNDNARQNYRAAADAAMAAAAASAAEQERQQAEGHEAAAAAAVAAWKAAKPCEAHPYLERKGVSAYGLRMASASMRAKLWNSQQAKWQNATAVAAGDLLVPMVDAAGNLVNLQRIDDAGEKRFLMGGRKQGTFHRIDGTAPAWLAEGYATGATVRAATGAAVIVAFDAGNLRHVAAALPATGLHAVAADNDANDAGRKGAESTGLAYIMPPTVGNDWNDHATRYGLADVGDLLNMAKPAAPAKPVPAASPHGFMVADSMAAVGVYLTTNDKREPHANLSNHIEVLSKHPRFSQRIWYDTFHQEIFTTWDCDKPRRWVDSDRLRVAAVLQKDYALVRFNDDQVEKAAIAVAHADQRDELRDWLTSLRWDGMPRLQGWLANTVGAPADDYHDAVGNNFIISMVARGMRPGCKADSMPVFEGDQGAGKSRLLALLGGDFYAELTESLETKDFFVVLQGKWLIEIAELDAFRRADVTRIKQVLSSHQDRCRLPYGRRAVDLPRRVVFAGTTNETEYLKDTTGARRFWPVAVSKIDCQWLANNREQLFAEAVECFNNGATWWEVPVDAAKEQTEARRETDAWETHIADHCRGRSEVVVSDVLQALGIEISRQGKPEQMRATRTLSILGYKRRKVKRFGKAVWAWQLLDAETAPF